MIFPNVNNRPVDNSMISLGSETFSASSKQSI